MISCRRFIHFSSRPWSRNWIRRGRHWCVTRWRMKAKHSRRWPSFIHWWWGSHSSSWKHNHQLITYVFCFVKLSSRKLVFFYDFRPTIFFTSRNWRPQRLMKRSSTHHFGGWKHSSLHWRFLIWLHFLFTSLYFFFVKLKLKQTIFKKCIQIEIC